MASISGSDNAFMFSLAGVLRAGAGRAGYHSSSAYITVAGTDRTSKTRMGSLTIQDNLDHQPNTARITFNNDFTPAVGQSVIIQLGSTGNAERLFGGRILSTQQVYIGGKRQFVEWECGLIDYTWELGQKLVSARFVNQDASDIIDTLVATYAPEFTSTSRNYSGSQVNSTLGTIDEITFTQVRLGDALTRIMRRVGGYWKVEYFRRVQAFLEDTYNPPLILTDSHASLIKPFLLKDNSQLVTRAIVEGRGTSVLQQIGVGQTSIPVEDGSIWDASGGTKAKAPKGQILTYTARQIAGGAGAVTLEQLDTHSWIGQWASQSSPISVNWTDIAWSPALKLFCLIGATTDKCVTSLDGVVWTERTMAASKAWTGIDWSPSLALFVAVNNSGVASGAVNTSPDGITWTSQTAPHGVKYNDVVWNADDSLWCAVATDGTAAQQVMTSPDGTTWTARTSSTAVQWRSVEFAPSLSLFCAVSANSTQAMTSPDGITWTTRTMNSSSHTDLVWSEEQAVFVALITGSSTCETSSDGTNWTSRTMPSSQSWSGVEWSSEGGYFVAVSQTAAVSKDGIIWVAQTAAEVSGAVIWSTLLHRFVAVGPSNAIMTRDLLSVEPSADVGDTSMRIDAVENFQSGGGWFRVEEQVIRYTGRGASTGESTLIGIPATGTLGAILAALPIGASVVPLPAITGVPSSGDGSVLVQLEAGEGVNILITRNDATAQSALATLLGGSADGIFEDYKQDRRLAQDEAENQGDAMLTLGKDLVQEFTWGSRNPNTRSGKTQVVDLTSPQSIDTNYKIQSVSISEIDSRGASHAANTTGKPVSERMPLYRANASTVWFSFEDLIRQMRIGSDSKEA